MLTAPQPSALERVGPAPDQVWRLSVRQYHEMAEAGILTEDDPVELLDGFLVPKMTKNPPHSLATGLTCAAIARLLPPGWFVDSQEPITTFDSEPEPDVRVVRGDRRDYLDRHPGPDEVALVVEVSDASLERDRTLKLRTYARAGIQAYWILDLRNRRLEVYAEPSGPAPEVGYRRRREVAAEGSVRLEIDRESRGEIAVRDLLP